MLTFRNPEDKTSCIVLNQESRRERMKADTSVAVASVVRRRQMGLILRNS